MSDEQDIAFAREILRTVFGLDKKAIDNVIREIRSTADITRLKTYRIRQDIGERSLRLIRNGIDAAKEQQTGEFTHDDDDAESDDNQDYDQGQPDDEDQESEMTADRQQDDQVPVKRESYKRSNKNRLHENNSQGEFDILKEFLVDVDPTDDEEPMRIKRMMMQAQRPGGKERLARQMVQKADDERDQARSNGNSPTDNINQQISRLKYQLAQMEHRKASMERHEEEQKQRGTRSKQQKQERQ